MDGIAVLTVLLRGEDYTMTIPYAHCKGILMGTLSMELGGKVNIICEKTGCHTELEFKCKVTNSIFYFFRIITTVVNKISVKKFQFKGYNKILIYIFHVIVVFNYINLIKNM